jgi:hypothetical protein
VCLIIFKGVIFLHLLIGNAIMLIASLIMVGLGLIREKKKIILFQTFQIILMAIGSIFLCSVPGAVINLFACVRNMLAYHDKLNKNNKLILIILSVGFSLAFNNLGIWGLFPIISSILYICLVDTKDVSKYKLLEVISTSLWLVHDIHIFAYTCVVFDVFTIFTNVFTFVRLRGFCIPQFRRLARVRAINENY